MKKNLMSVKAELSSMIEELLNGNDDYEDCLKKLGSSWSNWDEEAVNNKLIQHVSEQISHFCNDDDVRSENESYASDQIGGLKSLLAKLQS